MFYNDLIAEKEIRIMGIVNVTPDSFSDGGNYFSTSEAVLHAENLIKAGADIIDIGGESTRPGSEFVSEEEELKRVIPVIKEIVNNHPNVLLSIDTTKSNVAQKALDAGAHIINDISGGTFDDNMFDVAGRYDVPIIIMHIKGIPKNMQDNPTYDDVILEINDFFAKQISFAKTKGISKIILDPGIGFGKRVNDNYEILNRLNEFSKFELPILVGLSKKTFLGKALNLEINKRENATIIAETISALNGANIIRTHNVENAVQLKKIISLVTESVKQ